MVYLEHKRKLVIQVCAYLIFCIFNIVSQSVFISLAERLKFKLFLVFFTLQVVALLVVVIVNKPEDCFNCFNRIQTIRYSAHAGVLNLRISSP